MKLIVGVGKPTNAHLRRVRSCASRDMEAWQKTLGVHRSKR